MANYEHKAGNGSLFKNKYKEKENQPDYRGSGKTEDGQDIEIAGWIKQTNNGEQMLSLSFSKPYKKNQMKIRLHQDQILHKLMIFLFKLVATRERGQSKGCLFFWFILFI